MKRIALVVLLALAAGIGVSITAPAPTVEAYPQSCATARLTLWEGQYQNGDHIHFCFPSSDPNLINNYTGLTNGYCDGRWLYGWSNCASSLVFDVYAAKSTRYGVRTFAEIDYRNLLGTWCGDRVINRFFGSENNIESIQFRTCP
jgi:hypothetical protein